MSPNALLLERGRGSHKRHSFSTQPCAVERPWGSSHHPSTDLEGGLRFQNGYGREGAAELTQVSLPG